jgi:hypothetical protein
MTLLNVLAITLGFVSAIVMAYPIIRFDKVEINTRTAWTGDIYSQREAKLEDMSKSRSEVFADFNKQLFDAFKSQRKFTILGLALQALST